MVILRLADETDRLDLLRFLKKKKRRRVG